MRARCAVMILSCAALASPVASGSPEQLAGAWKRVSSNLSVRVEQWGESCGPAPKSYSNAAVVETEIAVQGRHLVFSKGGLRTDRCSSANAGLSTRSEKISGTRWERVCETPAGDPKFEHDEYVYVANSDDEIEYVAKSRYDWTLKGDRCALSIEERRVFRRSGGADPAAGEAPGEAAGEEPETACERSGALRRLHVTPKDAEVGPGERVCFKAFGTDEGGCRFAAEATWTAEQNGVAAPGLMGRSGCFRAGATAAESEGTYAVTALFEGKRAGASVTVVFPDFGPLSRARLRPAGEADGGTSAPAAKGAAATPAGGVVAEGATAGPFPTSKVVAIAAIALLAAAIGAVALFLRARARRGRSGDGLADDDEDDDRRDAPDSVRRGAAGGSASEPPSGIGMVCPSCHRGYGNDARFCPHDSEKLLPYAEWRSRHRRAK